MVVALWHTIDRSPLIFNVCWHENVRHDVVASWCLVLVDDMRDGDFEGDESRHQISWYEVSCTQLLISLLAWVLEMLGCLWHYLWPVDLFVHFLWVSASIVDPFCGTHPISLCSIAELMVWFWFVGSYQTMDRHILYSFFQFFLPWRMRWVLFMQSYWNSSYALFHLWCEFISGLPQFEFESFLQGLVQQNNQYLLQVLVQ